ncbi:MAG: DNA-binding protein [Burkholderiaceae bacterium]
MARGISETDVWQAADALLLEGARPTIERVRQKMGRGSPNTVSPFLDTWFRSLGRRIADPGAFSAPPSLPDAISQAAEHFWGVALAEARRDGAAEIAAAQEAAARLVSDAQAAQATARLAAEQSAADAQRLQIALDQANHALTKAKVVTAEQAARLGALQDQVGELQQRLTAANAERAAEIEQAAQRLALSEERSAATERRAALEIDRERQLRAKLERSNEQAEEKYAESLAQQRNQLEARAAEALRLQEAVTDVARERNALQRELGELRTQAAVLLTERDQAAAEAMRAQEGGRSLKLAIAELETRRPVAFSGRRRPRLKPIG